MRFKEYLKEYYVDPMPDDPSLFGRITSIFKKSTLIKEINHNDLEIKLYLAKLASNSHSFVFTLEDNILGFVTLQLFENTKYWQVLSANIFRKDLRGRGIMPMIYLNIVDLGYQMMHGGSLSSDAEKMWKKLITQTKSNTYDSVEDKLLPTDDKPTKDNVKIHEGSQRYFWLIQK